MADDNVQQAAYHPGNSMAFPVPPPGGTSGFISNTLDRVRPIKPTDRNMRTTAPDVGSAPAEWDFPAGARRVMQDT